MISIFTIIGIIFCLFAFSRAVLRFKAGEINTKELMFWGTIWLGVVVLFLLPNFISFISKFFGINRGVDLVIYISIVLLFYLIFRIYVRLENIHHDTTRIVRELALKKKK